MKQRNKDSLLRAIMAFIFFLPALCAFLWGIHITRNLMQENRALEQEKKAIELERKTLQYEIDLLKSELRRYVEEF